MDRDEYFVVNGRACITQILKQSPLFRDFSIDKKAWCITGFAKKIDSRGCLYHFMESNVHQK